MTAHLKDCLCKNFLAAIDMFARIVTVCPPTVWNEKKYFYLTYHTVIFLDYYLSSPVKEFHPLLPYTVCDPDNLPDGAVDDVIPDRHFTQEEMLNYINSIRMKCRHLINVAWEDKLQRRWISEGETDLHGLCPPMVVNYSLLEILFYNLRHIQHHSGQLNLLLRQRENVAVGWIAQSECVKG